MSQVFITLIAVVLFVSLHELITEGAGMSQLGLNPVLVLVLAPKVFLQILRFSSLCKNQLF